LAILNPQGELVYHFDGGQSGVSGRKDPNYRPNYLAEELKKGWAKLNRPPAPLDSAAGNILRLPEVTGPHAPAGVRVLSRSFGNGAGNVVTVRAVPIATEQRQALSFATDAKTIEAKIFQSWLELLQMPRVREADANIPFQEITGSLALQPASSDEKYRYMIITGSIAMTKGKGKSSAELQSQGVVTYRPESSEVHSLRCVFEGEYLYRPGRGQVRPIKISAALESTPE
jgi:hypothetical protein